MSTTERSAADKFAAVMERRKDATSRVSETARFIGFGLLAISYAMISNPDAFFVEMRTHWATLIRLMALAGAVVVLVDYLHYLFGYLTTERALNRVDKPNTFNSRWLTYRLEILCFWAKQIAAIFGCCLVVFLVSGGL